VPLDREQRAVFRARLNMKAFRGPVRLTANAVELGRRLVNMLGQDGRLHPSIETLAALLGIATSTVQTALDRLKEFGFVSWTRRIARCGARVVHRSGGGGCSEDGR